jgi:hypothetical protein
MKTKIKFLNYVIFLVFKISVKKIIILLVVRLRVIRIMNLNSCNKIKWRISEFVGVKMMK